MSLVIVPLNISQLSKQLYSPSHTVTRRNTVSFNMGQIMHTKLFTLCMIWWKFGIYLTKPYCYMISSVQFTQSCLTLCDPMDCSMAGFPVHHQLLELAQTHVHRVGDAIQSSHPLLYPSPPTFNLSQSGSFLMSQFFTSGGQNIQLQLQHQSFQ